MAFFESKGLDRLWSLRNLPMRAHTGEVDFIESRFSRDASFAKGLGRCLLPMKVWVTARSSALV